MNSNKPPPKKKLSSIGITSETWKAIQEMTFINWINTTLDPRGSTNMKKVTNISTDFGDGTILLKLLSVLSKKSVGKFVEEPTTQFQKLDNLNKVMDFITKNEKIKLVGIGKFARTV